MLKALFSAAKAYLIVKAVDSVKDAFIKAGTKRKAARPVRAIAKAASKPASRSRAVPKRSNAKTKKAV